jgi:hypothetical protein
MHFWRKESFSTLKDIAAKARAVPLWSDYADFCVEYERGLRSEAFTILERFISSMEHGPFADRRRFVSWLSRQADGREGRDMLIPRPLQIRLVEPTLVEWTVVEPYCCEPHLWLGGYDHIKRAFELEPDNQLARRKLIIVVLAQVDFASHELPGGYLGEINRDLATLSEAEELLKGLSDEEDRLSLAADIAEDRRLIEERLRKQLGN